MIQGLYCREKLDAGHFKGQRVQVSVTLSSVSLMVKDEMLSSMLFVLVNLPEL